MIAGPSRATAAHLGQRTSLRGSLVRDYVLGSLAYCARHPLDLPRLAPRAWTWYRHLLEKDLRLPFGVVLDLGYLLLDGDDFRFRGYFADASLSRSEREIREAYESRTLLRRLQESQFPRLHRLLRDSREPDRAVARALELLLAPAARSLTDRYDLDASIPPDLAFEASDPAEHRRAFEATLDRPNALLRLLAEVAEQGPATSLDDRLADEDFYELEHIRVFPRDSLREVARGIKRAERHLGELPRLELRHLRDRALAATSLASVGTYPIGGIAELTTRGPIENLAASELMFLDREEPIDLFLVRFAENELLKYLRDSAVLHLMRRTVAFYLDESDTLLGPVTVGDTERGLRGIKMLRCLLGLVLALVGDFLRVFAHDDVCFELYLVQPDGANTALGAERRDVAEVVRLLLAEREEAGTARVEVVGGGLRDVITSRRADPGRSETVIVLATPERLTELDGLRLAGPWLAVPVAAGGEAPHGGMTFSGDPVANLRGARELLLEGAFR